MKIAVVGKGGAGKTTVSALFARFLASRGHAVLAIDADINQHLGASLGIPSATLASLPKLGHETTHVKEYVRGTNPRIRSAAEMVKTTPPGTGSRLLRVQEPNPLWDRFVTYIDGVRFMAVGAMDESDIGVKCYHAKTGSAELVLGHIIDTADEYIICDMTAGADSFASGMFARFDMTLLIAEPTEKSVSVCKQYMEYAKGWDITIRIIGNQVENEDDRAFLVNAFGNNLIACIARSAYVRHADRGTLLPISKLEPENTSALEAIRTATRTITKDWEKSYRDAVTLHIKNAESWASAAVGADVTKQIDPDFVITNHVLSA